MGSAIASPSTTPVAFVGRPHGPPRCKSAPLYHRAQVARPISQGLQGGETPLLCPVAPGCAPCARLRPAAPACVRLRPLRPAAPACARLRPLAPACARLRLVVPSRTILHRPAPSHPAPFAAQPRRTPVPSRSSAIAPQRHRTPAPSHSSPFALQRHRTPAPSHSCTVTPRPFASLLQSLPLLFPTTSPSKAHSHTALQSSRKSLEIDHRPISPNQMLLFFELLEFRANSHHSTP